MSNIGDRGDPVERNPLESLRAAEVSRRYFIDGKTKSEIAEEFSISRFKVARMIEWAQETGITRIEIESPPALDLELGTRLERTFHLRNAVVVASSMSNADGLAVEVGSMLGAVISDLIEDGDVLGVGWGRTLSAATKALTTTVSCPVVQLIGATDATGIESSSTDVVREFSQRLHGQAHLLHAPFYLQKDVLANELRDEPIIRATLDMFPSVTKAVLGVGSWVPPDSGFYRSIPAGDRDEYLRAGTVADVCAIPLDADGRAVPIVDGRRLIAMSEEQLRRVPLRVIAASGPTKVQAILAALRGDLAHILVTDSSAAHALLEQGDRSLTRN